jgi:HAD superfamily hydrolase (TIGR01509 family)
MNSFPAAIKGVEALLCDADGCLFPSEAPAFEASVEVTNSLMEALGSVRRFDPEELRLASTGKNFRTTSTELAAEEGRSLATGELERWVEREVEVVSAHLARALTPDHKVLRVLAGLPAQIELAVVTSSAMARLKASLEATGLEPFFPPARRFSAEDSLDEPRGKPDPAVYLEALRSLEVHAERAVALEDSVPGVRSAVGAGIETIGNLAFVPKAERAVREDELRRAGAQWIIYSWSELPAIVV